MSEHYDFHYQPTGSGAISGQQVLEQTEDAINELGDYVYNNVGGAMDVAQQALETAQNAEQDAQTALDTANSFSSAIQSAQQDASTALSTAQTAQTTASNANNTAIQAQQDASNAVTTANNASGQVSTLSGTVTALGQRVTIAEGNIGQNTSDISSLTTRVGTAEGNITTLQNDVSIAQGNASSAMATAGQVKQQAYVFRYSSTALVASSTNSNALLDNTDNLKVGDKVIDSSGVLFSITAIDTVNSTFTVGSALVDLALDANVVHTSGDETIAGTKRFGVVQNFTGYPSIRLYSLTDDINVLPSSVEQRDIRFTDKNNGIIAYFIFQHRASSDEPFRTCWRQQKVDGTENYYSVNFNNLGEFYPENNNGIKLGTSTNRWAEVYATNYYYGANNVEFSTKFVTTDTAQTISGSKTFSSNVNVYNSDSTGNVSNIVLKNSKAEVGTEFAEQSINFVDKNNNPLAKISCYGSSGNYTRLYITAFDSNNNSEGFYIRKSPTGTMILPTTAGAVALGNSSAYFYNVQTNRVNALEPSSLSLPSGNVSDVIDISSYITDMSGTSNSYTVPANGWISIAVVGTAIDIVSSSWSDSRLRESSGNVRMLYPVLKNETLDISITGTTLAYARFIPCQGNV